jgi:hypothetical protein
VNAEKAVTDTPPRITGLCPTGVVTDTTPTIRATVVYLQEELATPNINVLVVGDSRRNLSYNVNFGPSPSQAGGWRKAGTP